MYSCYNITMHTVYTVTKKNINSLPGFSLTNRNISKVNYILVTA